jgi:hypothetical protein
LLVDELAADLAGLPLVCCDGVQSPGMLARRRLLGDEPAGDLAGLSVCRLRLR